MSLTIQKFPEDRQQFYLKNPHDLYRMPYNGTFETSLKADASRTYLIYIPEKAILSTAAVVLVPCVKTASAEAYLEKSGWMQAADENGMILAVAAPDFTLEEVEQMNEEIRARDMLTLNKSYIYIAGYGSGAEIAQRAAMRNPILYSGVFTFGNLAMTTEDLEAMAAAESNVPGVPKSEIAMPMWMAGESAENVQVLAYWKHANKSQDDCYRRTLTSGLETETYFPQEKTNASLIDEVVGGKVIVSAEKPAPQEIWEFFRTYMRTAGIGNWNLHFWKTPEEQGMKLMTLDIEGYTREFYMYVPEKVLANPEQKVPMVVSYHGGSNLHTAFASANEWTKVAEARNIIVLYPASAIRPFKKTNWLPHAAWNSSHNSEQLDDELFTRKMVEFMIENYPVDAKRVYASGHSMGSAMGQRALLCMPDIFAAAGLTSGVLRGGFFGDYNTPGVIETWKRPIWIIMGEKDTGNGTYETNPDMFKNAKYWTERNETQHMDDPAIHRTGAYMTRVYFNKQGVPMVQFSTVDNKPHSGTTQDSFFLYDEWLSKFSMNDEKKTVYMNYIVVE